MTDFTVKLANIPIGVKALFSETHNFCKDYLTEEVPAFEIVIAPDDIAAERRRSKTQSSKEGCTQIFFSDAYLETLTLYRKITAKLIHYNVILLHGAVMAYDGKAYLFTARSGTGKTTHCKLWQKNIPGCHILNGDKPLLLFRDNIVYACGTPWMGKEEYGTNEILPLDGICVLERSIENRIRQISFSEAFPVLLKQTHIPVGEDALQMVITLLKKLNTSGLYSLECNMEDDAAMLAYQAMIKHCKQVASPLSNINM